MVEIRIVRDPVVWGEYAEVPGSVRLENRFVRAQKVQETSLEVLPSAELMHKDVEHLIVQLLDSHPLAPFTTYEIGVLLGKPVNCLTQAIKTLREKGKIVIAGHKLNPTGATALAYITPSRQNEV